MRKRIAPITDYFNFTLGSLGDKVSC